MAPDPVRAYKEAKEQFDEAYAKVVRIRRVIGDVNQMMVHPYEILVNGTDVVFPPEIGLVRTPTLFAADWPSAKQIAQSLVALHEKYRIAQKAWMNLSQEDKANLEELPEKT